MNRKTVEVFHGLMKNGWIDREEDEQLWTYVKDAEVLEELEEFKAVMGIDLFRSGNRLYMIPTQDNDLFLKNNMDYRRDIQADNEVRKPDIYLMNYLSVYLIYLFFSGEDNDPQSRDFISCEELISRFTEHCKLAEKEDVEQETEYSENFRKLAAVWLGKVEGEPQSQKIAHKYGVLNRILRKYKKDELFMLGDDGLIRPTRKMKDLMPYFLRKDRVAEIQNWIKGGEDRAENQ